MNIFLLAVLGIVAYIIITGPSRQKKKAEEKEKLKKQLLTLFRESENLLAVQVDERLEERTGGRKFAQMFKVIPALDSLVEERKLVRTVEIKVVQGEELTTTRYSLPKR